ncbi:MAG: HEAT repeat domain-containing protein [Actinobacteria bacterium]|nr:HEAT repeat domain-containing protein [Actinomycetota bacterium]
MTVSPVQIRRMPPGVERFVKQLVITMKAVKLYPVSSTIPLESAEEAVSILTELLKSQADMRLSIQKAGIVFQDVMLYEGQPAFESFAKELYNRRVSEVRFYVGTSASDILALLETLTISPPDLANAGGVETRLWDRGVNAITVLESSSRIVDMDADTDSQPVTDVEPWPPAVARIDEILASAMQGRPLDQRILVRIVSDTQVLKGYLRESAAGRGVDPSEVASALKIEEMARAALAAPSDSRRELFSSLAEAILSLDDDVRYAVIADRLLPHSKNDEAISGVLRQMKIDEVCRTLVQEARQDSAAAAGLARAIRNLALLSHSQKDEILNSAGAAMRSAGFSSEQTGAILEEAMPTRVQVSSEEAENSESGYSILKLLELVPKMTVKDLAHDLRVQQLVDEARQGISDGDVVATLAAVVAADTDDEGFASMMSLLEDALELTIERRDFRVAADVLETLVSVLAQPDLSKERATRLGDAIARLAGIKEMAAIASANRIYDEGSEEKVACLRILEVLGDSAINPLLEVLANEPEMTARKALVDLIASMVDAHLEYLGEHVSDSRWYFVRNVIIILGRAKKTEILPYLERTIRHPDARVRRETIRALFGVRSKYAEEMLLAALDDQDASNVRLAARYLGMVRSAIALPALQELAAGESRVSREPEVRIEAIEALGKIGAIESIPLLRSLAGQRALMGGSKLRGLNAAAELALEAIDSLAREERGETSER